MVIARPILCAVLGVTTATEAMSQSTQAQLGPFLKNVIQLDADQIKAVDRGELVTKQLPTQEKAEIAAFGIVRVAGAPATLGERARDVQSFRKLSQVSAIGRFGNPPRVEDLEALILDDVDFDLLKRCVTGKCGVKLNTGAIERIQKEVDWTAPDAKAQATKLVKQLMVDYVQAYLKGGTDAMGVIVDKEQPRTLSTEFLALLSESPYLFEYLPAFSKYVRGYPQEELAGTEDILFWMKDNLGPKPVVSIHHATIHRPQGSGARLLLAFKQIYASHFYNAGLEISVAVDAPDAEAKPGFYLLTLYRTRIDPPTGMLAGVVLGKVRGGIEKGVAEKLKTAKILVANGNQSRR